MTDAVLMSPAQNASGFANLLFGQSTVHRLLLRIPEMSTRVTPCSRNKSGNRSQNERPSLGQYCPRLTGPVPRYPSVQALAVQLKGTRGWKVQMLPWLGQSFRMLQLS